MYSLGVEHFGTMAPITFQLLQAKLPYNFGRWRDYANFIANLQQFSTTIELNTYMRGDGSWSKPIFFPFDPITNALAMHMITQGHVACFVVRKTI